MVDPRGVEPLSENHLTAASPGAAPTLVSSTPAPRGEIRIRHGQLILRLIPNQKFGAQSAVVTPVTTGTDNRWADGSPI